MRPIGTNGGCQDWDRGNHSNQGRIHAVKRKIAKPPVTDSSGQVRCFDQVADTKNAFSFIAAREEIDPARIGVIGHSFGAAVAVYTAGIDERFACVISSCGWGDGERKFRGQHPTPEAWAKFTGILEQGRKHKAATGESMWVSRFDVVPIPESLRNNLSPKALMEVPVETAISMYNFRAEDVVANIAPRPLLLFHTANDVITPTEQSIRLYEKAGQPLDDRGRAAIRAYADTHPRGRHGTVVYEPEVFGIDVDDVRRRLRDYTDRFGVTA